MAIDGITLNQIIKAMQPNLPIKINKIIQTTPNDLILQGFGKGKVNILLSAHPVHARVQFTENKLATSIDSTHFSLLLRKHLQLGWIRKISTLQNDRITDFEIEHRNEMGVLEIYHLYLEIIGRTTNIILVDSNGIILDALRRIMSFESDKRNLVSGSLYELPDHASKLTIEHLNQLSLDTPLRHQFYGISPLLEKEIIFRLDHQSADDISKEILQSQSIYITDKDFHVIELTHLLKKGQAYPIMSGLDHYYETIQQEEQIKAHTNDLAKRVRKELKKYQQKLPKLLQEQDLAQNYEIYKDEGDLLYAFAIQLEAGHSFIELNDFMGQPITIALNPKFGGKENARRKFKQYQKMKTSISYREAMILETENQITYFTNLLEQLDQAQVEDAIEIKAELIEQGVLRQVQTKSAAKAKPKKVKPHVIIIPFDHETNIFVGKNNLQNDYVSFKIAKKEDTWFHAAHTSGAHVVIQSPSLNEEKIRAAAMLAAYYSKNRLGSSVEVHYTLAKNIKKVAKGPKGLVHMDQHKSIFIDPDENTIKNLLKL